MINFKIFTLFPEIFPGALGYSITGDALKKNLWNYQAINSRDYAFDSRGTVDDTPYGGNAGMVFKPDVIANALEKNNIREGIAYYWKKMREFIQVEESTDFSFIRDLRLRVEGVQREVVVNDYAPEDPEIKDMLSRDTSLKWKRNIKNKKELVSYERKNQEESLTKNRQRYIFYTDKPVALKNLFTLYSDFKNIIHDVTVINKTLMVELKENEITEEKFYFLLDKVENIFLEYEISKINKWIIFFQTYKPV
jgi:hypothetical protein